MFSRHLQVEMAPCSGSGATREALTTRRLSSNTVQSARAPDLSCFSDLTGSSEFPPPVRSGSPSDTIRTRAGRHTGHAVSLPALLFACCALLAAAGTASAQTVKLVGNTSLTGLTGVSGSLDYAQKFTTGTSVGGYRLTRVDIRMSRGSGTAPTYSVSIHSDGDEPGTSLGTLTNPDNWPNPAGLGQHPAPSGGIALAAGTSYWLVWDVSDDGNKPSEWVTSESNSDSEDSDGQTGWSIANGSLYKSYSDTAWSADGTSLIIAIHGHSTPPSLSADQVTQTGARLTIANYLGGSVTNWYYKANKAPHTNCSAAQTNAAVALSGLTQNTSYTYKAYSDSGCTAANELATETFRTHATTEASAPPVFGERSYRFELPENADGRRRAVALGTVSAEDPDGEAVTYALASDGGGRFAVGSSDGAVTYTGPGEDYESDTNRYELTVRARDPDGEEARTEVVVEVTDVNEAPSAGDDAASVAEDERVVVDVLANDTDPDSDRLRVTSVSAPSHGTARAVSNGRVAYVPEADYHGTDRFTYVVSDGGGLTAEAAVEITVTPVNDPPKPVGVMPDQTLDEGGEAMAVDVAPYFEDGDGDALAYRASSSDPSVAAVAVAGSALTLTPVSYGSAVVTVTAEDAGGLTAEQTFVAGVSDRLAHAVVTDTLAGMARSQLASARMTLARRVSAGGRDGGSRLTVLGRSAPLDRASAEAAALRLLAGFWAGAGGPGPAGGRFGAAGTAAPGAMLPTERAAAAMAAAAHAPGGGHGLGGLGGVFGFGGGMDPLRGSEFQLALGGGQEASGETRRRGWQVWGQGDIQTFAGAPSEASGYEGDVRTGYVGMDAGLSERWLAGVAVSRAWGAGDWRAGSARGALSTRLTAAHPYVQWSDGSSSMWATAGAGWGTAANARETGRTGTSDLDLLLGLVEVHRSLDRPGGADFGVRADAAWAQLRTGTGEETIDGQTAAVNQLRAGVEASRPVRWDNGVSLSPFGEAHVRRDAGAGQTGTGLEAVGGMRLAGGRLRMEAQGRLLVLHSAAGYRERGVGVTLGVGSPDREGLSLSVSPRWGDAASGGGTLWQEQVWRSTLPKAADDAWEIDARGEYGMRLSGGRLLTWFGSLGQSAWGRRFSVGGRVGMTGDGLLSGK